MCRWSCIAATTSSLGLADRISRRAKLPTSLQRGHQSRLTMSSPFCSCTCLQCKSCSATSSSSTGRVDSVSYARVWQYRLARYVASCSCALEGIVAVSEATLDGFACESNQQATYKHSAKPMAADWRGQQIASIADLQASSRTYNPGAAQANSLANKGQA